MTEQIAEAIDPKDRITFPARSGAVVPRPANPIRPTWCRWMTQSPTVVRIWKWLANPHRGQEWQSVAQTDRHWKEMRGGHTGASPAALRSSTALTAGSILISIPNTKRPVDSADPAHSCRGDACRSGAAQRLSVARGVSHRRLVHLRHRRYARDRQRAKLGRPHTHETVDRVELR